uniref:Transmembrane protein n=1 Tax=Pithovirus LCPAC202 TaxID=2506592 RepID=A0A481Z7K6_9VIRU|nr:MAG: uncharacterized protein LCPAC202_00640 [Pithovirus LCPAC202]
MEKNSALVIYLVIVIIIFIIARFYLINIWSSIVLALLIGLVVLFFLTPQGALDQFKDKTHLSGWLYIAIWGITLLILLIYILDRIFRDRSVNSVGY